MKKLESISWGNEIFDHCTGGIPKGLVSVVETPDYLSGNVVLGNFILDGLKKGEKCVLVSFDSAESFASNFRELNIDFEKYLNSEQLIFLNYNPNITYETSLTFDYDNIFEEISYMCGGQVPARIAFQQVDSLVNLNNQVLINASAQKLSAAGTGDVTENTTILGQYVQFEDSTHKKLSVAFQKTMTGFFSIEVTDPLNPHRYRFQTKKLPWFGYQNLPESIRMSAGDGIVRDEVSSGKVA